MMAITNKRMMYKTIITSSSSSSEYLFFSRYFSAGYSPAAIGDTTFTAAHTPAL